VDAGPMKGVSHCGTLFFKKIMEFMESRDSTDLFITAAAMSHPEPDESSTKSTTNEYSFVKNKQLDASNIQNLVCHETLHVSGIF
jgi:rRNA pseudouridine-1189 N-methylase Emg1 (Nep1/Mra1 family)